VIIYPYSVGLNRCEVSPERIIVTLGMPCFFARGHLIVNSAVAPMGENIPRLTEDVSDRRDSISC